MIYINKYQKIIDIINEPYNIKDKMPNDKKPNVYGRHIFADKALILLDMPAKEKAFHGSSYEFLCSRDICTSKGQVVVDREKETEIKDKIEKLNCEMTSIHKHPESVMYMPPGKEYEKESHIHFICAQKSYDQTIIIAKFLRNY